ncbi:MAG: hypothetical protein K2Y21_05375 [Phycisphaerales bacterium]|nr:hypothetical protein [Phycisphaerales bacterium]
MPQEREQPESVETRLQRLEEAQLYAQHDQEAMLAALEDLSQRFDTLLVKLTRLESRVQQAARGSDKADAGDGSAESPNEDGA